MCCCVLLPVAVPFTLPDVVGEDGDAAAVNDDDEPEDESSADDELDLLLVFLLNETDDRLPLTVLLDIRWLVQVD